MKRQTRQAIEIACRQIGSARTNTYRRLCRNEAPGYRRDTSLISLWSAIDLEELERILESGPTATWRIIRALCKTLRHVRQVRTIHGTYRYGSEIRTLENLIICELHLLIRQNSASNDRAPVHAVEIAA